jgi:hypothetical protein
MLFLPLYRLFKTVLSVPGILQMFKSLVRCRNFTQEDYSENVVIWRSVRYGWKWDFIESIRKDLTCWGH